MQTAQRRRMIRAGALAAVVHAVVLTVLAFHAPRLHVPVGLAGPPEPIIPVLIMPRAPPPVPGSSQRAEIRLHRRPQRFAVALPPIPPLEVPEKKLQTPPAEPAAPSPAPLPPPPLTAAVRNMLRLGPVGCANPGALGLTRAERETCDEQFAAGARDAPFIPAPMSPAKRADFDAAGARKAAVIRGREAPLANAGRPPQAEPQDYSGEPYITGSGQSAIGAAAHPASQRAARKLQQLPP